MKKSPSIDPSDTTSAEDLEAIKAQMLDMQMEIDILKEKADFIAYDLETELRRMKERME